jgi:hypothetical protein
MKTKEEIFEEVINYAHMEGHYNKHDILLAMELYADQFRKPEKKRILTPEQLSGIATGILNFAVGRIGKKKG